MHVLAPNGRAGVVLLAMATKLFEHLRVDFQPSPLGQKVERLTVVQVVVELAVRPETGKRPTIDKATLPQAA